LEDAAKQISKKDIEDQKLKTKIRRLYDIANVLQSIGLIQKTSLPENNKPAFQWIGIQGVKCFVKELKSLCIAPKNSASLTNEPTHVLGKRKSSQLPPKLERFNSMPTLQGSSIEIMLEEALKERSSDFGSASTNLSKMASKSSIDIRDMNRQL